MSGGGLKLSRALEPERPRAPRPLNLSRAAEPSRLGEGLYLSRITGGARAPRNPHSADDYLLDGDWSPARAEEVKSWFKQTYSRDLPHSFGQTPEAWNTWRREHSLDSPDLSRASLDRAGLFSADLHGANLSAAGLRHADLRGADLSGADLRRTRLQYAGLTGANLRGADLRGAFLTRAEFIGADLRGADLSGAILIGTNLLSANLSAARVNGASVGLTSFADIDLREVEGLEDLRHERPSEIGIGTLYRSEGRIPEVFLRGCGVPDSFIVLIPSLVTAMQPVQFHSCFISYTTSDEGFARRLHSRMREADLRVWFAPEDMKGGDKIYDQIDRAIQIHDRLLLVLSESSLQSKWVETEIRRARKVELKEGRRKLFPIRLTTYEALQNWVCIDSSSGEDLAEEVRGYFIPDFSKWKSHDDFERAFARLYEDLKATA